MWKKSFGVGLCFMSIWLGACNEPMATQTEGDEDASTSTSRLTDASATSGSGGSSSEPVTSGSTGGGLGVCGDGVAEDEEECDDGNPSANDACLPTCKSATCGDLSVQLGIEECDDGNQVDTDHCTNACMYATCGDGIQGPGEGCDDGNQIDKDDCSNDCILSTCGDGDIQAGEDCDEGVETPECNKNCTESKCGDNVANEKAGESCDDGAESPTCNADCSVAACGDGKLNAAAGESCDDAGASKTCDDNCSVAECGDGELNVAAGEACDGAGESPTCNTDCSIAECGDGKLNASAGEACDAAGESKTCNSDCSSTVCGDGKLNIMAGEKCDDGNVFAGDFCSLGCSPTISLAAGEFHTCAVYLDSSVHCWGRGMDGQLGYMNTMNLGDQAAELPAPSVSVGGKAVQISLGGAYTCAQLDTGSVRCWGAGIQGQLGYGNNASLGGAPGSMPAPALALDADVLRVATGGNHTCALLKAGTMKCWGDAQYGALGSGGTSDVNKPGLQVPGVAGVKQMALGYRHTCALLTDGSVRCWGGNDLGQLGLGHFDNLGDGPGELPPMETKVSDVNDPVVQIAAGSRHTCAVLSSGKVRCWGSNSSGQVGAAFSDAAVGDKPGEMPPADVNLGEAAAVQVVAGSEHTCALLSNRKVKCWGLGEAAGSDFFFDDIDEVDEFPPPDIMLPGETEALASHLGSFTCALLVDKSVRCWGHNSFGQLGVGNTSSLGQPTVAVPL